MLIYLAIFLLATFGYFKLRRSYISAQNRQYTDYVFVLTALVFTLSTDTLTTILSVALVYFLYTYYKKTALSSKSDTDSTVPPSSTP